MLESAPLGSGGDKRWVTVEWRDGDAVYFRNFDYGDSDDLGDGILVRDGIGLLMWLIDDRFCASGLDEGPLFRYLTAHDIAFRPATDIDPDVSNDSGRVRLRLIGHDLVLTTRPADEAPSAFIVNDKPKLLCQLVADRCQGSDAWNRVGSLVAESGVESESGWSPVGESTSGTDDDGSLSLATVRARRGQNVWQMLPVQLAEALARSRGLRVSKAADDLLATAGDPPAREFIIDVWPVLVDEWLAKRPGPRERLTEMLRAHGVGPSRARVDDRAGELRFLSACNLDATTAQLVIDELTVFAMEHYERSFPETSQSETPDESEVGVIRSDGSVVMRSLEREDLTSHLDARRGARGTLVISGHDLGSSVDDFFGSDDYEYTKTFAAKVVPQILEALGEDPADDVIQVIAERWCGTEQSFEFERILQDADIPHQRWSS